MNEQEQIQRNEQESLLKYAKSTRNMAIVCAVCCFLTMAVIAISSLMIVPQLISILSNVETAVESVNNQLEEISRIDFNGMASNIDSLVTSSEQNITKAMDNFNNIDFDSLNSAIKDLADVVAPLRRLTSIFQ